MNRKFFAILEGSYLQDQGIGANNVSKPLIKKPMSDDEDDFSIDPQKLLTEYANKNRFETNIVSIDYQDTYKMLDRELPPLPEILKA